MTNNKPTLYNLGLDPYEITPEMPKKIMQTAKYKLAGLPTTYDAFYEQFEAKFDLDELHNHKEQFEAKQLRKYSFILLEEINENMKLVYQILKLMKGDIDDKLYLAANKYVQIIKARVDLLMNMRNLIDEMVMDGESAYLLGLRCKDVAVSCDVYKKSKENEDF